MGAARLQGCDEGAALSWHALHPHRAAVKLNQLVHQGEPDARALVRAGARPFYPVETFEQVRYVIRGNADPGVRHGELDVVAAPPERDADSAGESVLECV